MNLQFRRAIRCAMGTMIVCLLVTTASYSQSAMSGSGQKPQMSQDVFKNIQVLRGIPGDEFMGTMGFFAASLNMNCTDCHVTESAGDWMPLCGRRHASEEHRAPHGSDGESHQSLRHFGAMRKVTCYTCHRGYQIPEVVPSLDEQYGSPPTADPDRIEMLPKAAAAPDDATKILDKFIQAVGGAQQLAKLNSFTAKGTYSGFDTDFKKLFPRKFLARLPISGAQSIIYWAGTTRQPTTGTKVGSQHRTSRSRRSS